MKKYRLKKERSKSKTVVEIVREGTVNYVGGRELDGKKWEKCKLCLIKTVGGYMLEFYAPPKVWENEHFCWSGDLGNRVQYSPVTRLSSSC